MAMFMSLIDTCESTLSHYSVIALFISSILSIIWWYIFYIKRISAIPKWKPGRGRPPRVDTRERDYYSAHKRNALKGNGYFFAVVSIVISAAGALIALYTIFSGDLSVMLFVQKYLTIGACTAPITLTRNKGWAYTMQFVNIVGRSLLIFLTMLLDYIVNLYHQINDESTTVD